MHKALSKEVQISVPASEAWKIFGTLELTKVCSEHLPHVFHKIDVEEGDGSVGTVLKLSFPEGKLPFPYYKEKFIVVDNEKRVKVAQMVEGGFLNLGFKSYLGRFEVIENGENSSIVKASVEFELEEELAAKASMVNTQLLENIVAAVANVLTKQRE